MAPLLTRICCQFPHVDSDVVAAVLESAGGVAEPEAILLLRELQADAISGAADVFVVDLDLPMVCHDGGAAGANACADAGVVGLDTTILRVAVDTSLVKDQFEPQLSLVVPSGELWPLAWHEPPITLQLSAYGKYRLLLESTDTRFETSFLVSSAVGDYSEAIDAFFDSLAWAWDGAWTEDLQDATLNLLVGIDEFMDQLSKMVAPLLPMLGGSFRSLLDQPRRQLENQLAKVLEQHDGTAVGMTHGALRDLLQQVGAMVMLAPTFGGGGGGGASDVVDRFSSAATVFEEARQAACSEEQRDRMCAALGRLIEAADAFASPVRQRTLTGAHLDAARNFERQWISSTGLREQLQRMASERKATDLASLARLQGSGGGFLADMFAKMIPTGGAAAGISAPASVEHLPFLDAGSLLAGSPELSGMVARWNESLVSGCVVVGSPIQPMKVLSDAPSDILRSAQALQLLMRLGFGYVTQANDAVPSGPPSVEMQGGAHEGMLMAMLDRRRATLPLREHARFLSDKRRRGRLRDVMRVVRSNARQGRHFSLRVNTDLDVALSLLREHHEDTWVGTILENIWHQMFSCGDLLVFELWMLDAAADEERLVAADFTHPHTRGSSSVYVATRFFDRAFKTCMPGFILAFAEVEALARRGFELWDLGGTNSSPMMSYKPQVAIEMARADFLDLLNATQRREQLVGARTPEQICPGVLIEHICEDDLWGAAACRKLEQPAAKAKPKVQAKASKAPDGGEHSATGPSSAKAIARLNFKKIVGELCAQGYTPTEAAKEAVRRAAGGDGPSNSSPSYTLPEGVPDSAPIPLSPQSPSDAAKAMLQQKFAELCAEGMGAQEAAAEAVRQLAHKGSAGSSLDAQAKSPVSVVDSGASAAPSTREADLPSMDKS